MVLTRQEVFYLVDISLKDGQLFGSFIADEATFRIIRD
jgi:hypothetical protein